MATDLEIRELAVLLHSKLCHANHTDGCGWGYEYEREVAPSKYGHGMVTQAKEGPDGKTITDWTGYHHRTWFARATKMVESLEPDVPIGVIYMVVETL